MWRRSKETEQQHENLFANDVDTGLSSSPRFISSRWFYDATGDELFQKIMAMPSYYLTRAEYSVLEHSATDIDRICGSDEMLNLVELGAGDGLKTRILLRHFQAQGIKFRYLPIDISAHALEGLANSLKQDFPNVQVNPLQADYFTALRQPILSEKSKKLVLFLGSNVGNMLPDDASSFYTRMFNAFQSGDYILTGFDRVKDPEVILRAYDDEEGITSRFNLNLLDRINRELGANFNPDYWIHKPEYDTDKNAALSFLVSLRDQDVHIPTLGKTFHFHEGEKIHTEISRKFRLKNIEELAVSTGFRLVKHYHAYKEAFTDSLWVKP